ncbi:tRNA adenosine(34) deaminase TadA [Heyndrickxia oleronia]|uniref:tRNA-specific adenosine deaminase n=1 Tax=Heyndrickxia oleronia TaxID=38875 RepID=A0A8E2LER8_9BACI|nr:tRNA adenosine(34) deaminase TadA [Heyndrickxia oleronia]NYV68888.1 tRNA adenosine(34) deaminase TadA [Bacillus sp. Gen3]MBU5215023.1 tRNA adenosine(34) deaminase TadA [Heyndrickxia oleronia]MEC1377551.1 tRNA adenosine(34) deaminase TadA [Heyndrickxia oleronia]OOP68047.1 tRNA adenosine(34) deaminase TadA [Heyndrickxia oleronia]QQZ07239.1 tRNA adenosine(34) deaminase TadA [Heyndrickxia oleronia]
MVKNADEYFMKLAISEAKKAEEKCEVPIGAVVVLNGEVIATAHNLRESTQNAITHAEILAIQKACERIGSWRLEDAELYVTLEPCPMCSGAIILSRIKKVIFGAHDPKAGCAGTLMNLLDDQRFNHQCEVVSGVLENECSVLLRDFFRNIRKRNKAEKEKRKINESNN